MEKVLGVILGGGQGTRLYPLTSIRSKPAVPFAGKYRLVDIPISNCINSGIKRIFVLTQFNSASLNHHIVRTYRFDSFSGGFLEVLAAQQSYDNLDWFQGTADAVRKHVRRILRSRWDDILILAGDQLYRMDFRYLHKLHIELQADVAIAAVPVTREEASRLGIMKVDEDGVVTGFAEKPGPGEELDRFAADPPYSPGKPFLASTGIYMFRKESLGEMLDKPGWIDFGRDIIPGTIHSHRIVAYTFTKYWEDIGTIKSFFETNLQFCRADPVLNLFTRRNRFFTRPRFLPGSVVQDSRLDAALLCEGCRITDSEVSESTIGIRSIVRAGSVLEKVVMMGADIYEDSPGEGVPLGIGRNCRIRNAILDKNARIGDGVSILNEEGLQEADGDGYMIRDGVIIVPKNAVIESGTTI